TPICSDNSHDISTLITHLQAHLKFASEHLHDSEKAWEKVLLSDEVKISLFRNPNTTVKLLDCYSAKGTGQCQRFEGPMDGARYAKISDKKLHPSWNPDGKHRAV
uniref:Uncharacterized protein n=1 Tax=Oreochromis aureus TaxID=47969 RepID=A0AAZ1Y5Q1_OREAU